MNGRVNGEKFVSKEIMVILCTLWHFYEKSSRKGDFSSHYYFSKGSSWMDEGFSLHDEDDDDEA